MTDEERVRLDRLLLLRGLFESREKGRHAIEAGAVQVDGVIVRKPGVSVRSDAVIRLLADTDRYVGRGGYKLEKAIEVFGIDFTGQVVLDVGASTGGFTHCALLHGASFVHSVDVGHGQLDTRLQEDVRVRSLEGCDIRSVRRGSLDPPPEIVVVDLSFISLSLVLPSIVTLLDEGGLLVCLVKPQFEAGREAIGKNGIARGPADHVRSIARTITGMTDLQCICTGLVESPIKGGEGNTEYLLAAVVRRTHTVENCRILSENVLQTAPFVVKRALETLRA